MKRTFAASLKASREDAGITMRVLADRVTALGVKMDSSTLHRLEHGQREPKLNEALALSQLLRFELPNLASALDSSDAAIQLLISESIRAIDAVHSVGSAARALNQSRPNTTPRERSDAITYAVTGIHNSVQTAFAEMTEDEWQDFRSGLTLLGVLANDVEEHTDEPPPTP